MASSGSDLGVGRGGFRGEGLACKRHTGGIPPPERAPDENSLLHPIPARTPALRRMSPAALQSDPVSTGSEPPAASPGPPDWLPLLAVAALAALVRLPLLRHFPDIQTDEGLWTNATKNRLLFGDWFMDERGHLFLSPVFHTLSAVAFRLMGPGLDAARTVSAVAGVGAVVLVYLLAARLTGDRTLATVAALLLALEPWAVVHSRQALVESVLLFFILAAGVVILGGRRHLWVAGVLFGLAILTKLNAGAMGIALGGYLLLRREGPGGEPLGIPERVGDGAVFGVVALACAALGYWLVAQVDPERFVATFRRELGGAHLLGAEYQGAGRGRLGLDPILAGRSALEVIRFSPFLVSLGLLGGVLAVAARRPERLFLVLWLVVAFAFPMTQVYQPIRYFYPAVPVLAVLTATVLVSLGRGMAAPRRDRGVAAGTALVLLFSSAYLAMTFVASPRSRAVQVEEWVRAHAAPGDVFLAATHFATAVPLRAYSHDIIADTPERLLATVRERGVRWVIWDHEEWSPELLATLDREYTPVHRWEFGGVYETVPPR